MSYSVLGTTPSVFTHIHSFNLHNNCPKSVTCIVLIEKQMQLTNGTDRIEIHFHDTKLRAQKPLCISVSPPLNTFSMHVIIIQDTDGAYVKNASRNELLLSDPLHRGLCSSGMCPETTVFTSPVRLQQLAVDQL